VAEGARLESVYTARYPGFESLSLRHTFGLNPSQSIFTLEFPHRLLPGPMISTEELSQFIDPLYAMPLEPKMGRIPFKRRRSRTKTFGCGVLKSTVDCGVGA
jgi:hypothetical protein